MIKYRTVEDIKLGAIFSNGSSTVTILRITETIRGTKYTVKYSDLPDIYVYNMKDLLYNLNAFGYYDL